MVEEVKLVLKPAYNARKINKEQYKEILRKAVPKVIIMFLISNKLFLFYFYSRYATVVMVKLTLQK